MGNKYNNKSNYNCFETSKITEKRKQLQLNIEYDGDISITISDRSGIHPMENQAEINNSEKTQSCNASTVFPVVKILEATGGLTRERPIPIAPLNSDANVFIGNIGGRK